MELDVFLTFHECVTSATLITFMQHVRENSFSSFQYGLVSIALKEKGKY